LSKENKATLVHEI